jgi:hypothetical protein
VVLSALKKISPSIAAAAARPADVEQGKWSALALLLLPLLELL